MPTFSTTRALLLVAGLVVACGGGGGGAGTPDAGAGLRPVAEAIPLVGDLRLAASADGVAWLVWGEGDLGAPAISAAAVDPSGGVVRSAVSPATPGTVRDLQVAISATGPVAAWRSYPASGTDIQLHVSAYEAGRWDEELTARASFGGTPQLLAHADGGMSVLWQRSGTAGSSELVVARRSSAGQWSPAVVIATTPSGIDMGVARHAIAGDGSMIAMWTEAAVRTDSQAPPQVLRASRYDPLTATWGPAAAVDSQNGLYYQYDVAAAVPGEWVAVWVSGTPIRQGTLLSRRWTSGAWADPVRIDGGDDHTIREVALARAERVIHLVWTGLAEHASPGSVRASTFDSAQASWSLVTPLGRDDTGYPQRPRLASTADGQAVALWELTQTQANGGPFVAERASSGGWGNTRLLNADGTTGFVADLARPSAGEAIALWFGFGQAGLIDIHVTRWRPSD